MSEELKAEDSLEVEIAYSLAELQQKIKNYGLNPHHVCARLRVNLSKLKQINTASKIYPEDALYGLYDVLKNWNLGHTPESFTHEINQLIFLWLNAIQDGATSRNVLNLLGCFELKSMLGFSITKIHLFLFDLFAETTNQHQQLTLDYLANFDANTQLPNVNQVIKNIEVATRDTDNSNLIVLFSVNFQAARNKLSFSKLIALSLNKQIAKILEQNIPEDAQLFFGGDSQFEILITSASSLPQLNLVAAKITRAFEQMLFVNQQSILVTPFIGCAHTLPGKQSAQQLYSDSKIALDAAIETQQMYVICNDSIKAHLLEQNNIEAKVIEAFGSDQLTLFFQPIVNLNTDKCAGAELLLRWSQNFGYSVYPNLTVEILNKVGKGKLFTRWLINSACRYVSELIHDHKLNIYLTVNLRAEDLYDTELPHLLMQAISLWKLSPKDIILEITENGILEYNDNSNSVISQLAENGFRFALDDFGTGFSSLSRLRTMPIDLIKIDQSFVRDITHSKDDFEIVQSIAMLAKSLGKEVLAEGVEDEDCLILIKKLKIDKVQGYLYAKPMPFEQFVDWAKAH